MDLQNVMEKFETNMYVTYDSVERVVTRMNELDAYIRGENL